MRACVTRVNSFKNKIFDFLDNKDCRLSYARIAIISWYRDGGLQILVKYSPVVCYFKTRPHNHSSGELTLVFHNVVWSRACQERKEILCQQLTILSLYVLFDNDRQHKKGRCQLKSFKKSIHYLHFCFHTVKFIMEILKSINFVVTYVPEIREKEIKLSP